MPKPPGALTPGVNALDSRLRGNDKEFVNDRWYNCGTFGAKSVPRSIIIGRVGIDVVTFRRLDIVT